MEHSLKGWLPLVLVPVLLLSAATGLHAQTYYGFAGKPYDPVTGLYDFGYRDYSPETGRFITQDPLRDGNNWYSYVNQDPVNYTDLLGLKNIGIISNFVMSTGAWAEEKLNGWDKLIKDYGCAIALVANVQYTRDCLENPKDINEQYVKAGNLCWSDYASSNGMSAERITGSYTAENFAAQEKDLYNNYYTGIYVPYNGDGDNHWVGVNGMVTRDDENYFVVSATSKYDTVDQILKNRFDAGWIKENDTILIPESKVQGAIVFKEEKHF